MPSLRRTLLWGTGIGTAAVLVVAGMAVYWLTRVALLQQFDGALREKALVLGAMIEQNGSRVALEFAEPEMAGLNPLDRREYYQVWNNRGKSIGRSPALADLELPRDQTVSHDGTVRSLTLPGALHGRAICIRVDPRIDDEAPPGTVPEPLTLAVARDMVDVDRFLDRLKLLLVLVVATATITSIGVLGWRVSRSLRPVDRLAGRIASIDEKALADRLDPTDSPAELAIVAVRLNEMLDRLDNAFRREQLLTANAAHELRTPLAGIRTTLEVALSRDRDAAAYRQALADCLHVCTQTQRLVDDLLSLARLESGADVRPPASVNVAALLSDVWQPFDESVRARGVQLNWDVAADLCAVTVKERLRIALANVLGNAAEYVDSGGSIAVAGVRDDRSVELRIANTGSQLSRDDLARVFDPFWRGDAARRNTGSHFGLGLALCRTIMNQLGGSIEVQSGPDGWFTATIRL